MEFKKKLEELNNMVLQGKNMEAFELFYHQDVVMQENNDEPCYGKEANREREIKALAALFGNIETFHGAEIKGIAYGDNLSMVEWSMDMTFKNGVRSQMNQVCVQRWQDDLIISERFYYPNK